MSELTTKLCFPSDIKSISQQKFKSNIQAINQMTEQFFSSPEKPIQSTKRLDMYHIIIDSE